MSRREPAGSGLCDACNRFALLLYYVDRIGRNNGHQERQRWCGECLARLLRNATRKGKR